MMMSGILPSPWGPSGPSDWQPRVVDRERAVGPQPSLHVEPEGTLAVMARLIASNDRLMAEAQSIRRRIEEARAYLSQPGCHARLGAAYLDRLQLRRSAAMALLRANRIEARALLASLNP